MLLDALPILQGGRFLEAEVLAALTAGPWPARAPDRNLADLKAQVAACQTGARAVAEMIRAHGGEVGLSGTGAGGLTARVRLPLAPA